MLNVIRAFYRPWLLALGISAMLTGCATSRDIITPQLTQYQNPAQGIAVRIDRVEDARHFEIKPVEPSIPSLMDDNISDTQLRARAIARKRNGYGKALGDLLLPEGMTVSKIIETAIAGAFRQAGYRVVSAGDPDYQQAVQVMARIDKFWSWFQPGFWALTLTSNYDITVSAPIPGLEASPHLKGEVKDTMQLATQGSWAIIVTKSLEDFSKQLQEKLAKP